MRAIVLDIDETLLHTSHYEIECASVAPIRAAISGWIYYIYARPGVNELIEYCNAAGIKIIVFSAAGERYVSDCIDILGLRKHIDVCNGKKSIYTSDHLNYGYTKDLMTVLSDYSGELNYENTLAVDDNQSNYSSADDTESVFRISPWCAVGDDDELFRVVELLRSRSSNA